MNVGGYGLKRHLRLFAPLFGFIAAVWVLRLVMDALGISHGMVAIASVTGAASLAVLAAVLMIHIRGFGSYPNVVMTTLLLVTWGQLLVVAAILFSVATGIENVYTAPEYSVPGGDSFHLRHILGHLTFGIGGGTLIGAAMGSFLLWLLRMLVPMRERQ